MSSGSEMNTIFGPLVETADGSLTIKHESHGQDFHSLEGAKFEAWELYVVSSGLVDRLKTSETLAILDVGMGLGYNAAATIAAWLTAENPPEVEIISLEIDPRLAETLAGGEAPWCKGWQESWLAGPVSLQMVADHLWQAELKHARNDARLIWQIFIGDASQSEIPKLETLYEFIWQDPFTPELNPNMWSVEWFERVRKVSDPRVQLLTYSVARIVRDALSDGGWKPQRFPAIGKKRHWLRAGL